MGECDEGDSVKFCSLYVLNMSLGEKKRDKKKK